jgi:hypothetical protein
MRCFIKSFTFVSAAALALCCTTKISAQTVGRQNSCAITVSNNVAWSHASGSGPAIGPLCEPQNNSLDDLQPRSRGALFDQFSGQSPPAFNALTLEGKDAGTTMPGDTNLLETNFLYTPEPTQNYLEPQGQKYFSDTYPGGLYQPATQSVSSLSINEDNYFQLVRNTRKIRNQVRQVDGLSTQAWSTIVGWHPGGTMLQGPVTYETAFNPFFFDGESQP